MFKKILKESLIVILLCLAIVLILGVVFYDYMPNNKIVPNKIEQYETPNEIKEEIEEEITEENKIEQTYQVTEQDLKIYKQSHGYSTGKVDPFLKDDNNKNSNNGSNKDDNNSENNNSTENSVNPNITKPGSQNPYIK